jgi:hypothetical protein
MTVNSLHSNRSLFSCFSYSKQLLGQRKQIQGRTRKANFNPQQRSCLINFALLMSHLCHINLNVPSLQPSSSSSSIRAVIRCMSTEERGAFGLLDFTMLWPVLFWREFWKLGTVYFFNFPIFFRAAVNGGHRISVYGGTTVFHSVLHSTVTHVYCKILVYGRVKVKHGWRCNRRWSPRVE